MRMEEGRVYAFGSCSYGGRELNLGYHHHAAHVVLADAVTEDDEVEHRDEALEGRPSHQLANIIHAHQKRRLEIGERRVAGSLIGWRLVGASPLGLEGEEVSQGRESEVEAEWSGEVRSGEVRSGEVKRARERRTLPFSPAPPPFPFSPR